MTTRFDCVERPLSNLFAGYIRIVTRQPWPFVIIPVLVTAILMIGFVKNPPLMRDNLQLYTPTNAPAIRELSKMDEKYFISDKSPFYPFRRHELTHAGHIIVCASDSGGNILKPRYFDAAIELWNLLNTVAIVKDSKAYTYEDLCVRVPIPSAQDSKGYTMRCVTNIVVAEYQAIDAAGNDNITAAYLSSIRYPTVESGWFIGQLIGGATVDRKTRRLESWLCRE